MINSTVLSFERRVVGKDPAVTHYSSKHRFEYRNGSIVAYGGMYDEKQRQQIRSIGQDGGLDFVFMEEAVEFEEEDFDEIQARMRGTTLGWRQIMLATNPGPPMHWIKKRLIDRGQAKVFKASAHDNPSLPADYLTSLDNLTGVTRLRLRDGLWVQAEGVVYKCWDPSVHIVDRFPIPDDWEHFLSIDFGYTNPFTAQWWAVDPDGTMYLYRQTYMRETLIQKHAQQIKELTGNEHLVGNVCDHNPEAMQVLEDFGIYCSLADKQVKLGIQMVEAQLRGITIDQVQADEAAHEADATYIPPVVKPKLFLLRDSLVAMDEGLVSDGLPTCLEEEISGYTWNRNRSGHNRKEEPLKRNDHAVDCMRYACMRNAWHPKDDFTPTYDPIFAGGR
jgi:phage terminase large subunit